MTSISLDELTTWESVANNYQEFTKQDMLRQEILLPALFDMIGNPQDLNVADLGCGDGSVAAKLCEQGARVSACDGAPSFVKMAKKNLTKYNAKVCEHDLREPIQVGDNCFPAGSFDLVIANMVISSLPNLQPLFDSAKRLLIPGGKLIISTLHPAFTPPAAKVYAGLIGRLIPRLRKINVLNYFLERRVNKTFQGGGVPPVPYRHRTLTTLFNALRHSGFAVTDLQEPRPGKDSKVAKSTATIHALKAPIFILIEARSV
jgi:2-polyprenyl-3-methyl-5-hydroxy-6-metoxy-1,4-benzoquinol methylase